MHLLLTPDLQEIMARRPKSDKIKKQWRMAIHVVKELKVDYKTNKKEFGQSPFVKGGFFKKSFFVCIICSFF